MAKFNVDKRGRTWWLDTYIGGERVRRSTGFQSEAEAWAIAERIVAAEHAGEPVPARNAFTLGDAIELRRRYLEKLVAEEKRSARRGCPGFS